MLSAKGGSMANGISAYNQGAASPHFAAGYVRRVERFSKGLGWKGGHTYNPKLTGHYRSELMKIKSLPKGMIPEFLKKAQEHNVNPLMMAGIYSQEDSGYHLGARNPKPGSTATGIGQVIHKTASPLFHGSSGAALSKLYGMYGTGSAADTNKHIRQMTAGASAVNVATSHITFTAFAKNIHKVSGTILGMDHVFVEAATHINALGAAAAKAAHELKGGNYGAGAQTLLHPIHKKGPLDHWQDFSNMP
jgi:hypothetical protein